MILGEPVLFKFPRYKICITNAQNITNRIYLLLRPIYLQFRHTLQLHEMKCMYPISTYLLLVKSENCNAQVRNQLVLCKDRQVLENAFIVQRFTAHSLTYIFK